MLLILFYTEYHLLGKVVRKLPNYNKEVKSYLVVRFLWLKGVILLHFRVERSWMKAMCWRHPQRNQSLLTWAWYTDHLRRETISDKWSAFHLSKSASYMGCNFLVHLETSAMGCYNFLQFSWFSQYEQKCLATHIDCEQIIHYWFCISVSHCTVRWQNSEAEMYHNSCIVWPFPIWELDQRSHCIGQRNLWEKSIVRISEKYSQLNFPDKIWNPSYGEHMSS